MNVLALPPDLFGGIVLGGILVTVLARGLVQLSDVLLNMIGMDLPDENLAGYSIVTAAGMVFVAALSDAFNLAPFLLGFDGLLWKILAGLVGSIGVKYFFEWKARNA
jgi:tetrahydromethanopterin S-methyltransferase subunit E